MKSEYDLSENNHLWNHFKIILKSLTDFTNDFIQKCTVESFQNYKKSFNDYLGDFLKKEIIY